MQKAICYPPWLLKKKTWWISLYWSMPTGNHQQLNPSKAVQNTQLVPHPALHSLKVSAIWLPGIFPQTSKIKFACANKGASSKELRTGGCRRRVVREETCEQLEFLHSKAKPKLSRIFVLKTAQKTTTSRWLRVKPWPFYRLRGHDFHHSVELVICGLATIHDVKGCTTLPSLSLVRCAKQI